MFDRWTVAIATLAVIGIATLVLSTIIIGVGTWIKGD